VPLVIFQNVDLSQNLLLLNFKSVLDPEINVTINIPGVVLVKMAVFSQ